jgi:hypothetical protein
MGAAIAFLVNCSMAPQPQKSPKKYGDIKSSEQREHN